MCCVSGVLSGCKCRNPSTSNPVGEDRKLKTLSRFTVQKRRNLRRLFFEGWEDCGRYRAAARQCQ
ncbi:uncharacterized protein LACBIDRAFT_299290 [Laccaria bicolor S238N-H82]|uniref:Predicted protein n=1 Tax=Laccaria bicolor (strain S238N-H82 / ATCC MYA-4686) TaxID=486041 RepID=B0DEF5_LACBS|nr:uncharacterized protein LACBIDRAFT_299290 [Laccaria bicolor S238N-H82]EDR06925.1 predicted protein [Laccaria bicolor S238N-H82]|eukprot:XP_001882298.1 predicted protein [Laccaria bicolor S238N-H82]